MGGVYYDLQSIFSEGAIHSLVSIRVSSAQPHEVEGCDSNEDASTSPADPAIVVRESQRGEEHIEGGLEPDCAKEATVVDHVFLIERDASHEEAEEDVPSDNDDVVKAQSVFLSKHVPQVEACHDSEANSYNLRVIKSSLSQLTKNKVEKSS